MKERLRNTDAAVLADVEQNIRGLRELVATTNDAPLQRRAEKRLIALEKDAERLRDALLRD